MDLVLNTSMEKNVSEKEKENVTSCLQCFFFSAVLDSERRPSDRITSWLNVFYPRVHWQQNAEV